MRSNVHKTVVSGLLSLSLLFVLELAVAYADQLPFDVPSNPALLPRSALIETTKGPIEIEFYRHQAPITVRNFEYLGKKGFYENLTFHRFVPGFVIQGGDPLGNGRGGPGYTLPPEHSSIKHLPGTVGMARKPGEVNLERRSNGSQFYITFIEAKHLDGLYTVFGQVISGLENARRLRVDDRILSVRFPRE